MLDISMDKFKQEMKTDVIHHDVQGIRCRSTQGPDKEEVSVSETHQKAE
jgi:hypothetical protein